MHSKMFKRILAGILVFTLTFANPALVTKSFATSIFDMVNNQSDTGNRNVEFNAGFDAENEESFSAISDVNNEDLAINLKVNVKNKGYLKNGKVAITESVEGAGLNFEIKSENTNSEIASSEQSTEVNAQNSENVTTPEETAVQEITAENKTTTNEERAENTINTENQDNSVAAAETENVENISEMVEKIENNTVTLKQIDAGSEVLITLPIEYKNEEFVNLNKLSATSKVIFSGTYVDEEGEETEVSKEVDLTLSWKDEKSFKVSEQITKYIPYTTANGSGIILQAVVALDNTTDKKTLPVSSSELNITVPTINEIRPSKITVVAASTVATNGKANENVIFTENNWSYNAETNMLNIKVQNEKQLVKIENHPEDILKDAEKEVVEEERYYSLSGKDEYIITYSFENIEMGNELKVYSNIAAKVDTFSGEEEAGKIFTSQANESYEYTLTGQMGNVVSFDAINETENISKAYTYLNYNNT